MDIGFAYWWSQIAGTFASAPSLNRFRRRFFAEFSGSPLCDGGAARHAAAEKLRGV